MKALAPYSLFLLLAPAALGAEVSQHEAAGLPAPPAGFRAGMELELSSIHFAKMVDLFDFDRLQAVAGEGWRPPEGQADLLDDYLRDNPAALEALPRELREQLTRGLQLTSLLESVETAPSIPAPPKLVGSGAPVLKPAGLLGADGRPVAPISIVQTPASAAEARTVVRGGLYLPERLDWQELYRRWAALAPAVKVEHARWELLGPVRKAALAIALLDERKSGTDSRDLLRPKATLPAPVAELLGRLTYSPDGGGVVEIQHAPEIRISSPAELYRDIVAVARLAGVERKVRLPAESRLTGVSLHYHVSVTGRDFSPWIGLYNLRLAAERIHAGVINDMMEAAHYAFRAQVSEKGLVRAIGPERFEQRTHLRPLLAELTDLTELLQLSDAEVKARLEREIRALLEPATFRRILRHNHSFAEHFLPWLTPEQREAFLAYASRVAALKRELRGEALWRRLPQLMRSPRPDLQAAASELMSEHAPPLSFWRELPRLIADPRVSLDALDELLANYHPPGELGPELLRELLARPPRDRRRLFTALKVLWQEPNPAATSALFELLRLPKEAERQFTLLRHLEPNLLGPADLERLLPAAAAISPDLEAVATAYALGEEHDSPRLRKSTVRLLADYGLSQDAREVLFGGLATRDRWPGEITEAVLDRARIGELGSDHYLLEAAADHDPLRFARFLEEQIRLPGTSHSLALHFLRRMPFLPNSVYQALLENFPQWTSGERGAVLKLLIARNDVPLGVARAVFPESIAELTSGMARVEALRSRAPFEPACEAYYSILKSPFP